jgi:hypothetical protein
MSARTSCTVADQDVGAKQAFTVFNAYSGLVYACWVSIDTPSRPPAGQATRKQPAGRTARRQPGADVMTNAGRTVERHEREVHRRRRGAAFQPPEVARGVIARQRSLSGSASHAVSPAAASQSR